MEKEKKIEPVDIKGTREILDQMTNCICKIQINENYGTGFFCNIPFENNETKNFLITNYHILKENEYNNIKVINLFLNDDNEMKTINPKTKRLTFFNEKYDITFIEIKEEDQIKFFLELDDKLFLDKTEAIYENKSIYIIQYPKGKNAVVSYGLLTGLDNYEIKHKCSTDFVLLALQY